MAENPNPDVFQDAQEQVDAIAQLTQLVIQQTNTVNALLAALGNAQGGAPVTASASTFALTPGKVGVEAVIDYSTKHGSSVYKEYKAALPTVWDLKGKGLVVFIQEFLTRAQDAGWTQGSMQVTKFNNADGTPIDLITEYGKIDVDTLKAQCDVFLLPGGANFQTRATQNNKLMAECLLSSVTASAKQALIADRGQYTFDGTIYAPVLFKHMMKIATLDNKATSKWLRDQLKQMPAVMLEVKGNIDDFFNTFDKWHTQLIGRGEDLDDALDCLWDGLKAAPCEKFSKWIQDKYDLHIEDDPTWGPITVEELTKRVKAKYNLMVTNKEYGSASKEQAEIIALRAQIDALKGDLKLSVAPKGNSKGDKKDKKGGEKGGKEKKTKNTKAKGDKQRQKQEESWKKTPPKDGEPTTKTVGDHTFNWCVHHMAWVWHKSENCDLGKKRAAEQNHVSYAAAVNSSPIETGTSSNFRALMSTLAQAALDEE
uniref:Gag protein n=1 Tax=Thalassiosira pseudonana TaxID=35128 RepID=B1PJ42_THAPS|nr:gag protein [Thalassiosira pseudonana]